VDLPNDRQLAIETDPLDEDYSELLPETLTPRTATESDDSCSEDEVNLIVTARRFGAVSEYDISYIDIHNIQLNYSLL
jgi:hypothetical protein